MPLFNFASYLPTVGITQNISNASAYSNASALFNLFSSKKNEKNETSTKTNNMYNPSTYKILCIKNKFHKNLVECVKCNMEDELYLSELEYWKKKQCETVTIEINRSIPEWSYRNFFNYYMMYDWTEPRKQGEYRGYPRRLT